MTLLRAPVALRLLIWLTLPLLLFVGVPAWLRDWAQEPMPSRWGLWQWLGAWLIANGTGLLGWCVYLFLAVGQGTPVPWDPPKRFVLGGPYRMVRNPMVLGALTLLAGQALWCQSRTGWAYTVLMAGAVWAFVRFVEEPQLRRRYGQNYTDYCQRVPRWIPRLPK